MRIKSSSTEVPGSFEVSWFVGKFLFIGSQAGVLMLDNHVDQGLK